MKSAVRFAMALITMLCAATISHAIPQPGSPAIQPAAGYATITPDPVNPLKITVTALRADYGVFWVAIFPKAAGCSFTAKPGPAGWKIQKEAGAAVWHTNTGGKGDWLGLVPPSKQASNVFEATPSSAACTEAVYVIHVIDLTTGNTFWTYPGQGEPVCIPATVKLGESVSIPKAVLEANFTDPAVTPVTFASIGTPTCSTAVEDGANVVYTPTNDCVGQPVTIPYTVTDKNGNTLTSEICVTVLPQDDPECDVTTSVMSGMTTTIPVLSAGQLISVVDPAHGTAAIVEPGKVSIDYTPDAGYEGPDYIHYTYTNAAGVELAGEVCLTVVKSSTRPECKGVLLFGFDAYLTTRLQTYLLANGFPTPVGVKQTGSGYQANAFRTAVEAFRVEHGDYPCAVMFDPEYIGPNGQWSGLDAADQEYLKERILAGMGFVYAEPNDTPVSIQGQLPDVLPVTPWHLGDQTTVYNVKPGAENHPILDGLGSAFPAVSYGQNLRLDLLDAPSGVLYTNIVELLYSSSTMFPNPIYGTGGTTSYALDYMPSDQTSPLPGGRVAILGTDPFPIGYTPGDPNAINWTVEPAILELYFNALKWAAFL